MTSENEKLNSWINGLDEQQLAQSSDRELPMSEKIEILERVEHGLGSSPVKCSGPINKNARSIQSWDMQSRVSDNEMSMSAYNQQSRGRQDGDVQMTPAIAGAEVPFATIIPTEASNKNLPQQSVFAKAVPVNNLNRPVPDHLTTAIDIVKQAIAADESHNYEEAFKLYQRALEKLWFAYRNSSQLVKDVMLPKISMYLERAEKIERFLSKDGAKVASAGSSLSAAVRISPKVTLDHALATFEVKPQVRWKNVFGSAEAKKQLEQCVMFPIKFPKLYHGKKPEATTVLLHGPSGSGKSFVAEALAEGAACKFLRIDLSHLSRLDISTSSSMLGNIFLVAENVKPVIVLLDEFDALSSTNYMISAALRERFRDIIAAGFRKKSQHVFVLAASNAPWDLDEDVIASFQERLYLAPPNDAARIRMLESGMKGGKSTLNQDDFHKLRSLSDGYSAGDLENVLQAALRQPVLRLLKDDTYKQTERDGVVPSLEQLNLNDERLPELTIEDFEVAFRQIKPSDSPDMLKRYVAWNS